MEFQEKISSYRLSLSDIQHIKQKQRGLTTAFMQIKNESLMHTPEFQPTDTYFDKTGLRRLKSFMEKDGRITWRCRFNAAERWRQMEKGTATLGQTDMS